MILRAGCAVVMLVALGMAGGENSPYEKAIQKMIGSLDEIAVTLKTIVDEDTAGAAKPDLRKSATVWIETRAKAAKLQPPEKEEKARLEKLYKPKLEESMRKMFIEIRRVESVPGGKDALKEIGGVLKKDETKKPAQGPT
jgi:hypothetical protein